MNKPDDFERKDVTVVWEHKDIDTSVPKMDQYVECSGCGGVIVNGLAEYYRQEIVWYAAVSENTMIYTHKLRRGIDFMPDYWESSFKSSKTELLHRDGPYCTACYLLRRGKE
jgi:hypothetical protein